MLTNSQKEKWKITVSLHLENIGPIFMKYAIINGVVEYNNEVASILIYHCEQQIKQEEDRLRVNIERSPLYCVLRLFEKNLITDISLYEKFIGYYDLFDFVCFRFAIKS